MFTLRILTEELRHALWLLRRRPVVTITRFR